MLLDHCLAQARPGLALEFGVAKGKTLRTIAAARPGQTYGFDSFEGLPETWRDGFEAGRFACRPPDVPGAQLVVGWFDDTVPAWFADHDLADIGFVHIDCDLYSSTRTVLAHMPRLETGTVILFDELVGYPGWRHGEHRALLHWIAQTGHLLDAIGTEGERAAFTVTGHTTT
jgi:hypothetical protein